MAFALLHRSQSFGSQVVHKFVNLSIVHESVHQLWPKWYTMLRISKIWRNMPFTLPHGRDMHHAVADTLLAYTTGRQLAGSNVPSHRQRRMHTVFCPFSPQVFKIREEGPVRGANVTWLLFLGFALHHIEKFMPG